MPVEKSRQREDFGGGDADSDGVFEVRGGASVAGDSGPVVSEHFDFRSADVDHRFNRESHAGFKLRAVSGFSKVWNLRVFVHVAANAVADKFAYNRKSSSFNDDLDGMGNITEPVTDNGFGDACIKRRFSNFEQFLFFVVNFARRDGDGGVTNESAERDAGVDADNIALFDDAFSGNAVDDFFVDGDADLAGKSVVAVEGAGSAEFADEFEGGVAEFKSGDAGANHGSEFVANLGCHAVDPAHGVEFGGAFDHDHREPLRVEDFKNARVSCRSRTASVNVTEEALLPIEVDQRSGLFFVHFEPVENGGFTVIGALV